MRRRILDPQIPELPLVPLYCGVTNENKIEQNSSVSDFLEVYLTTTERRTWFSKVVLSHVVSLTVSNNTLRYGTVQYSTREHTVSKWKYIIKVCVRANIKKK